MRRLRSATLPHHHVVNITRVAVSRREYIVGAYAGHQQALANSSRADTPGASVRCSWHLLWSSPSQSGPPRNTHHKQPKRQPKEQPSRHAEPTNVYIRIVFFLKVSPLGHSHLRSHLGIWDLTLVMRCMGLPPDYRTCMGMSPSA